MAFCCTANSSDNFITKKTIIENGIYPVFTEKDFGEIWEEESLLSFFYEVWLSDYSYGTEVLSFPFSVYHNPPLKNSQEYYNVEYDDYSVYPSLITESTNIFTLPAEIFGGEAAEYVPLFDPFDESNNFIGQELYINRSVNKPYLSWDKFIDLLSDIMADDTVKVFLDSELFRNIDGYACRMILPKSIYQMYDFPADTAKLIYQKDNIAYVAVEKSRDEFFSDLNDYGLENLHVYQYCEEKDQWLLVYAKFITEGGLCSLSESMEIYEKLEIQSYTDKIPSEFKDLYDKITSDADDDVVSYDFPNEPTLTSKDIDDLLYNDSVDLLHDLLSYNITQPLYISKNQDTSEVKPVYTDNYSSWYLMQSPYADGTYGTVKNSPINKGYQKWQDWKAYLEQFFTDGYLDSLEDEIVLSQEGYICLWLADEIGVVEAVRPPNDYKVVTVKNGYAYLIRYRNDVEDEDFGGGEDSIGRTVKYALCVLKYDEDTDSWKIAYDDTHTTEGWPHSLRVRSNEFQEYPLNWIYYNGNSYELEKLSGEYSYSFTEEHIMQIVELMTGETVPETSDISTFTILFYLLSIFSSIVMINLLIEKEDF